MLNAVLALGLFLSSGNLLAFSYPNYCFSPDQDCANVLLDFMEQAEESVDIAIYSITHERIVSKIIELKERGLKVRVLVDQRQNNSSTSRLAVLVASKVPVKRGNQMGSMHHKFAIVDKAYLQTGSFNFSKSAESRNQENQVYLDCPVIVPAFVERYEQMWKEGTALN
jgi:mitochondrial cardiolipin hydrolase